MHETVELVMKSYMPKQLELGMWFILKIGQDTSKEYIEVWSLDKIPSDMEKFIVENGAPVEPYLVYDEQIIAEPHEIGWWDDGPEYDDLRDFDLQDVNYILRQFDGQLDVEIDDWYYSHDQISPVLYEGKVVVTVPGMYDEDYEEENPNENE
jgi:hypothetical protein